MSRIRRTQAELTSLPFETVTSSTVARMAFVESGKPGARRAREARTEDDEVLGSLFVEFRAGGVYHYDDVPRSTYESVRAGRSIGRALHRMVKGKHDHDRVAVVEEGEPHGDGNGSG